MPGEGGHREDSINCMMSTKVRDDNEENESFVERN